MKLRENKILAFWAVALFVVVSITSCATKGEKSKEKINMNISDTNSIQQGKEDLLAGVSKAVCYSGFRTGQHPDRGDGANNPTKEQILEDLQIVRNDMGFKLIRLYDSGVNSEMVLQIIQENNMDIKVLLGMWLNAELSAHESCAWLTEPIPQEKLDANKVVNKEELQRGINLANKYLEIVAAVNAQI